MICRICIICSLLFFSAVSASEVGLYNSYFSGGKLNKFSEGGEIDFHGKINAAHSGFSYYRWTWSQLEPEEGVYNFKIIDDALALAKSKKQFLGFRIMPVWQTSSPKWLNAIGVGFYELNDGHGSIFPDHNNPVFLDKHFLLLDKISQRYANEKILKYLDIGSVGCWGEWHHSCCKKNSVCESYFPTPDNQRKIIDKYFDLFSDNGLIGLAASDLNYIVKRGGGWRGDCFGDLGFFSSTSSHMLDVYSDLLKSDIVRDGWRNAPVVFETCFSITDWIAKGYSLRKIFELGLAWHVAMYNNFSRIKDHDYFPELILFLQKAGFVFLLDGIYFNNSLDPSGILSIGISFNNVGVAPNYFSLTPQVRLLSPSGAVFYGESLSADLLKIIPGAHFINFDFSISENIQPGNYSAQLCLKNYFGCMLGLGEKDGWLTFGFVAVTK